MEFGLFLLCVNFYNLLCLECVKYQVVALIGNYWEPGAGKPYINISSSGQSKVGMPGL